jgi:hypothetical protein
MIDDFMYVQKSNYHMILFFHRFFKINGGYNHSQTHKPTNNINPVIHPFTPCTLWSLLNNSIFNYSFEPRSFPIEPMTAPKIKVNPAAVNNPSAILK